MPTKRTFNKFVRDYAWALIAFSLAWIGDNLTALELDTQTTFIVSQLIPLVGGASRTLRGAKAIPWGTEPVIGGTPVLR